MSIYLLVKYLITILASKEPAIAPRGIAPVKTGRVEVFIIIYP